MNKDHVEVLKNQINEKKMKTDTKMNSQEYLMNRQIIENIQLQSMDS